GLDLTRQIKADPRNREIAVLAFTASDSREDDAQAIAAGTDGFVSKPIDTPVLLRTIAWHAAARELRLGVRRTTPVRRDTGGFERPLGAATRSPSAPVRLTDR
ncbi:MAG: response regulator, partial [Gemmatimonadota bacterium]|nr:response regulator [Gemmatimonadota bacterium]